MHLLNAHLSEAPFEAASFRWSRSRYHSKSFFNLMPSLPLRALLLHLLLAGATALRLLSLARRVAATACVASCIAVPGVHADVSDILQGATEAMMTGKEKTRAEKDFNSLPAAAQKRAALNAWCPVSAARVQFSLRIVRTTLCGEWRKWARPPTAPVRCSTAHTAP